MAKKDSLGTKDIEKQISEKQDNLNFALEEIRFANTLLEKQYADEKSKGLDSKRLITLILVRDTLWEAEKKIEELRKETMKLLIKTEEKQTTDV